MIQLPQAILLRYIGRISPLSKARRRVRSLQMDNLSVSERILNPLRFIISLKIALLIGIVYTGFRGIDKSP